MNFYEQLTSSIDSESYIAKNNEGTKTAYEEESYDISEITPDNLPLSFVKNYLRVDHDLDDIEIAVHIRTAQAYVRDYIKLDSTENLPLGVLAPLLSLIAHFYENKSALMKSTEKWDAVITSVLDLHKCEVI